MSNRCGGKGWDSLVKVQNYFGNTSSYSRPETGRTYVVDFTAACTLHDAGYGGHTVRDTINTSARQPAGPVVDFRRWSRRDVDDTFLADMRTLCRRQIPPQATTARRPCEAGVTRYEIVRTFGARFFDADLTVAGRQSSGARDTG